MNQTLKKILALSLLTLTACSTAPVAGLMPGVPQNAQLSTFSQPIRPVKAQLPQAKGPRPVTMFSYIAMDDKLSQFGLAFLDALEAGASNRMYNVAFADLEGPDSSFLSYIVNDGQPGKINSPMSYLDKKTTEVNSNDPETLSQTVNWAYSQYPSQMKIFDILAHGGGYFGLGTDDHKVGNSTREIMSVPEFSGALRKGLKGRQLDVLNFLSCLMGNVEAIYELRDIAKVVIASEDSVGATKGTTVDFTTELSRLSATGANPQQIGTQMVTFGQARNPNSGYYAIAALDMSQMGALKQAMNGLSNTLIRALPTHKAQITQAYDRVPELINSPNTGQRDLITLCNNLIKGVNHPGVQQAAATVKQVMKRQVLLSQKDKEGPNANGLSIFMPPTKVGPQQLPPDFGKIANIGYLNTRWAKETSWDLFIKNLLAR